MAQSAEAIIADELISHSLDLLRLEAGLRNQALGLLQTLQAELSAKLSGRTLTDFGKAETAKLLKEVNGVIQAAYGQIEKGTQTTLEALPEISQAAVRETFIAAGYGAALAPATHFAAALTDVMIQGAPSAEWWKRQSADLAFRFSATLRQGIVQGKANQQIISELVGTGKGQQNGILEVSRRNAAALVQTSVQTVANVARLESFAQNADVVKGVKQLSTLDGHTTDVCIAYSGGQWDLNGKPVGETVLPFNGGPPRHWNCRSILTPVTKTFAELGIKGPEPAQAQRASSEGPITATTTFDDFLKRKGEAYQNKMLGPGRAQLWRERKITLQQLLDLKGNPVSLVELQAKYAKIWPKTKQ